MEKIVVAAGGQSSSEILYSVELLYLNDDDAIDGEWVHGPDLPKYSLKATMVEYNNTVILISGGKQTNNNHFQLSLSPIIITMFQLSSPEGPWLAMKQKLKGWRRNHIAFLVPDEIVNCHE